MQKVVIKIACLNSALKQADKINVQHVRMINDVKESPQSLNKSVLEDDDLNNLRKHRNILIAEVILNIRQSRIASSVMKLT